MLEVRLIGTFDIKSNGKPVKIPARIAQSLLAYLILSAGTPHRREKLAGMFWPDATEAKARAYLRNELWRIRKSLSSQSNSDYLIVDDINISFNSSAEYWLDVRALTRVNTSGSADELMEALSAVQGELLPGFYDDWITEEREHLQALYRQKIARLLEMLEKEQRWNDMLEWAERWISLERPSEAAFRSLMVAYDALGDRARVSATYERCVQALRDMDLEPSELTRLLAFKRSSKLNVPIPLTSFIGRTKELEEVARLLSESRLVTLTGSGGIGKTRLSIQVVEKLPGQFPDGIWFLDLAPLVEAALVPNALANLLGLRESGESSVADMLVNYLRSRTALIIFDNCEHLIDSCAQLAHLLLTSCEHVSILATSREALRVSGEISYRVPSLAVPKVSPETDMTAFMKTEAVTLFSERAASYSPGFGINPENAFSIAQICQQLDGIPLAIELAAARVRVVSVQQIASFLNDRFRLLTGGARDSPERHLTLAATIDWSYQLLSERERRVLRCVSVFSGGFTLQAAEQVCAAGGTGLIDMLDWLTQLVDKSLVIAITDKNEARYLMLETIRQYGHDKLLKSGDIDQARGRHLAYFIWLAEEAEPGLTGPGRKAWLERLQAERDNFRTALSYSLEQGGPGLEMGLRLAGALHLFWDSGGYDREAREWLERLFRHMRLTKTKISKSTRAKAHDALGYFIWQLPDYQRAQEQAEISLRLYRQLRDQRGVAHSLSLLGMTARAQRDYPRAILLFEQSLDIFRQLGDKQGICSQLVSLAFVWWRHGEYRRAEGVLGEALKLNREIGNIKGLLMAKYALAIVATELGNYQQSDLLCREILPSAEELGDKSMISGAVLELGVLAMQHGEYAQARELLGRSLALERELGAQRIQARVLSLLGDVALAEGHIADAQSLYEQVAGLVAGMGDKLDQLRARQNLAKIAFARHDYENARAHYEDVLPGFREINSRVDVANVLLALGDLQRVSRNLATALDFYQQGLSMRCELGNPHGIAAVLERIAALAVERRQFRRAARLFAAAAQMREQLDAPLEPIARPAYEHDLTSTRVGLSVRRFEEEWALGRALTLEQVMKLGLEKHSA